MHYNGLNNDVWLLQNSYNKLTCFKLLYYAPFKCTKCAYGSVCHRFVACGMNVFCLLWVQCLFIIIYLFWTGSIFLGGIAVERHGRTDTAWLRDRRVRCWMTMLWLIFSPRWDSFETSNHVQVLHYSSVKTERKSASQIAHLNNELCVLVGPRNAQRTESTVFPRI